MNPMYGPRKRFFPFFLLFIPFVLLAGWVVMLLWNYILPGATGAGELGFGQALGLLVLSRILFGFPRGGWGGKHRAQWREKWMSMTDEERIKFKEEWRQRCGMRNYPPPTNKEQE
ncbi:MAG: hypothetical protein JNM68_00450 [Dinghuibacter sp.]|nr:hypothetical protein [Dinghuibacter sp.]